MNAEKKLRLAAEPAELEESLNAGSDFQKSTEDFTKDRFSNSEPEDENTGAKLSELAITHNSNVKVNSLEDELTIRSTSNERIHKENDRSETMLCDETNADLEDKPIEKSDISASKGTEDEVGSPSRENAIANANMREFSNYPPGPNKNFEDESFGVNGDNKEMSTTDNTIYNDNSKPGKFQVIKMVFSMFDFHFNHLHFKYQLSGFKSYL